MARLDVRMDDELKKRIDELAFELKSTSTDVGRQAIEFYCDHYYMQNKASFINEDILKTLDDKISILSKSLNMRSNKLLSQLAIQQAMLVMAIAENLVLSPEDLQRYRESAFEYIKTTDGLFTMDKAVNEDA